MSNSKRKKVSNRKKGWRSCGCWFCDPEGSKKKHNDQKAVPDPEQAKDIRNHTS